MNNKFIPLLRFFFRVEKILHDLIFKESLYLVKRKKGSQGSEG